MIGISRTVRTSATFGSGHYVATIVNLANGAPVATLAGYTPMQWLDDDRLVVSPLYLVPSTYLLSPSFTAPVEAVRGSADWGASIGAGLEAAA